MSSKGFFFKGRKKKNEKAKDENRHKTFITVCVMGRKIYYRYSGSEKAAPPSFRRVKYFVGDGSKE
jgi:hypothetical protein